MADKDKIKQYVGRQKSQAHTIASLGINSLSGYQLACDNIIDFIDSLPEEHINFPHERNIVDKVFGAGNLESWEYEEAEALVHLAKEELLKDLQEQKPKDWREEDEYNLSTIIGSINYDDRKNEAEKSEQVQWLKSLKPQSNWRPTKDQLEAFEHFVRSIGDSGYASPYDERTKNLQSLLYNLKNL